MPATGASIRNHESASIGVSECSLVVGNEETRTTDGVVSSSARYVYVNVEYEHLHAGQARTFAAVLVEAAGRLDQINGA